MCPVTGLQDPSERVVLGASSARIVAQRTCCAVCDGMSLSTVLELPSLPLTGIYVPAGAGDRYPPADQALLLCRDCGHGQLRDILDPGFVYGDAYRHRTSRSPIATQGNDFFDGFLRSVAGARRFKRVVDIGCNDLYLLRKLEPLADRLLGVDPIWKECERPAASKIKVVGEFAEQADLAAQLGGGPDLVVSAHTFEHVVDPRPLLRRLLNVAAAGALFVVEVPGFDSLLRLARFDQVFHQHLHYYSLASFVRLVQESGAQYLSHAFNYSYWGGTMLVAFEKRRPAAHLDARGTPAREKDVTEKYALFRRQLAAVMAHIEGDGPSPIYGLGAAQMLPVLAYHLRSDLSFLSCVLDDDPRRVGLTYPGLSVSIRKPSPDIDLRSGRVLITALDAARPLIQRAVELGARQILMPVQTL